MSDLAEVLVFGLAVGTGAVASTGLYLYATKGEGMFRTRGDFIRFNRDFLLRVNKKEFVTDMIKIYRDPANGELSREIDSKYDAILGKYFVD